MATPTLSPCAWIAVFALTMGPTVAHGKPATAKTPTAAKTTATKATATKTGKTSGPLVDKSSPKITAVMPFSSCSPGGSILLKGEHFRLATGTLRLVGFFPDRYLELTDLEWKENSIGGQVPAITGIIDQPVHIQVVRADGKVSNKIPCAFEATRVKKKLSREALDIPQLCYFGDAGSGCLVDDAIDLAKPIHSGCWHKNNACGGELSGVDELRTQVFRNGWRIKEVAFQQPQFADTEDQGVRKIWGKANGKSFSWKNIEGGVSKHAVDNTSMSFNVKWTVPQSSIMHYVFGFEVEGPEGVPYFEKVTIPEPPEQTLDDWNPHTQAGVSELTIVSPSNGKWVSTASGGVKLAATGLANGTTIQLEWIEYGAGKDPSIGMYAVVTSAPKTLKWSGSPATIPISAFGGPGEYAVRVRLPGKAWTDYRNFTIGTPYLTTTAKTSTKKPAAKANARTGIVKKK
jgi:hypothetical protein